MKNTLFVLFLLLSIAIQAQQTTATSEIAQVADQLLIEQPTQELTKFQQLEQEVAILKKENLHLKMLVDKHRQCSKGDQKNHSEIAGLYVDKAERRTIKRKSNQNTLPPPL